MKMKCNLKWSARVTPKKLQQTKTGRNAAVSLRDAQDVKDLERMEKEMIRGEKMGYGVKWTKESLKRSTSTAKYDINGRRIRLSSKK